MVEKINHPAYYQSESGLEAIDVIEAFNLPFHLGNVVKYILRAGKKEQYSEIEDLKKARWYLDREISNREAPSDIKQRLISQEPDVKRDVEIEHVPPGYKAPGGSLDAQIKRRADEDEDKV